MPAKGFRDCADAALRTECDPRSWPDARKRAEGIVDLRKAFGGKRALPACHALERGVDVNAEMDSTRDTAKPDDLGSDRKCGQELGTLQWFGLLRQH
jgi:hypothetical protein